MIAAAALLSALLLDRCLGEPPDALHPVAWMGRAIARGRDWALRARAPGQLGRGAVVALAVPLASAALVTMVVRAARAPAGVRLVVTALLLKPLFAVRALRDAAFVVRDALDAGDLARARHELRSLCSRPAGDLEAGELIGATVESIAENASDSIVAPLLFFAAFGLPGAAFYRASNTADAMIGYRGRLEWVGKPAARLDDLLNLIPARLTALALIGAAAAASSTRGSVGRGLATLWRDGANTSSPNAGRPMAAMAGLLGVRLVKRGAYGLGEARRPLATADITRAWRLVSRATVGLFALTAGALAWFEGGP